MYSRRLRIEEKRDKRTAFLYIVYAIVFLFLLFKFGLPYAVKLIGFVGEFKNASLVTEPEDKTPPPPPTFSNLPRITNTQTLEITGTTEPGVNVILTVNGRDSEVLANSNGSFSFTVNLSDGENTISAKSKDGAGNTSVQNTVEKVVLDTIAPLLEITTPSDGTSFYGTKQKQQTIVGTTDEDAIVQINGRRAIVEVGGSFSLNYGLSDGENLITITAEDLAGNKTETSLTVNFTP